MAVTHGMNPDEVERLGQTLQERANDLQCVVSALDSLVHSTSWSGNDANEFKGPWWDGHKAQLRQIAEQLEGFGQSAKNNASEQRQVSGG